MNQKIITALEAALKELAARETKTGHDHNLAGALESALALAREGDALRPPPSRAPAAAKPGTPSTTPAA